MFTQLKTHLLAQLDDIRRDGLYKSERVITTPQNAHVRVAQGSPPASAPGVSPGDPLLNMCANNYLGLAQHPDIMRAAHEALHKWGYGLASVRFICGTQALHKDLERKLSEFLGT